MKPKAKLQPQKGIMKKAYSLASLLALLTVPIVAHAAVITQGQNATSDASFPSWNSAIWGASPFAAPTSGNTYVTSATASGATAAASNNLGVTVTTRVREDGVSAFGGDSLTIVASTELLMKSGTSSGNVILNGGSVRFGPNAAGSGTLAGTLQVASESYLGVAQTGASSLTVNSTLTGSSVLHVVGGGNSGTAVMTISFGGDLSGFTGTFDVGGGTLNNGAATGEITMLDFNQNYTLGLGIKMADHTATDRLNLDQNISVTSFSFAGTALTAGTYNASDLNGLFGNGSQFVDGGGSLTIVPEPGAMALASLGSGLLLLLARRRRNPCMDVRP
jgi:hypothetical protein